jgi:hypothetical protein
LQPAYCYVSKIHVTIRLTIERGGSYAVVISFRVLFETGDLLSFDEIPLRTNIGFGFYHSKIPFYDETTEIIFRSDLNYYNLRSTL